MARFGKFAEIFYSPASLSRPIRITAAWPRVAVPRGAGVLSPMPLMRPAPLAQAMAVLA